MSSIWGYWMTYWIISDSLQLQHSPVKSKKRRFTSILFQYWFMTPFHSVSLKYWINMDSICHLVYSGHSYLISQWVVHSSDGKGASTSPGGPEFDSTRHLFCTNGFSIASAGLQDMLKHYWNTPIGTVRQYDPFGCFNMAFKFIQCCFKMCFSM